MPTIKEYIVVEQSCQDTLQVTVNNKIDEGWVPIGGASVARVVTEFGERLKFWKSYEEDYTFIQAMVIYKD